MLEQLKPPLEPLMMLLLQREQFPCFLVKVSNLARDHLLLRFLLLHLLHQSHLPYLLHHRVRRDLQTTVVVLQGRTTVVTTVDALLWATEEAIQMEILAAVILAAVILAVEILMTMTLAVMVLLLLLLLVAFQQVAQAGVMKILLTMLVAVMMIPSLSRMVSSCDETYLVRMT